MLLFIALLAWVIVWITVLDLLVGGYDCYFVLVTVSACLVGYLY